MNGERKHQFSEVDLGDGRKISCSCGCGWETFVPIRDPLAEVRTLSKVVRGLWRELGSVQAILTLGTRSKRQASTRTRGDFTSSGGRGTIRPRSR